MRYIQISKALYDYDAQTDEELSIREDDILYIIEKEDDDWWKAELKQPDSDEQGPTGLVPAAYLEEVLPIGRVRAEFDYTAQQEEELSFNEEDEMDLLETDDPNWYLVKSSHGDIGLVPSNYVQIIQQEQEHAARSDETSIYTPPQVPMAPPMTQVTTPTVQPILSQRTGSLSREALDDEAQSWSVQEYDADKKKKKKGKGNLFVGNGMICYGSETDKSLPVQQYPILDVRKYLFDGKNLHIELKSAILDLQASSKSEAKAILAKIADSSRAAQMSNAQLKLSVERQIAAPALAITRTESPEPVLALPPTCEPKWGVSLYTFQAEGGDEISVTENEQLYVVDYERTDGWYRVQKVDGDTGIIPSSYVQFNDNPQRKEEENRRRREEEERRLREEEERRRREEEERRRREEEERRRREEEERRRREEEERRRREEEEERRRKEEAARKKELEERKEAERKAQLARSNSRKDLPKPDMSKIRTWTDRSGSFKVEAQFIDFHHGKLRLHKLNGVKIDVPVEKMSPEDVRWVEMHGQSSVSSPQKKFNERWDWFDWFMIIGIPMQASLQYASAFKAEKLDDSDIPKLTHVQMKTLGLKEDHVRRIERFIETGTPEYYEDEENKKKKLEQDQIRRDEEYAKQVQKDLEQAEKSKSMSPSSNGRPRPTASTPKKEIHPDLLDFTGNQSMPEKQPVKVHSDLLGFNDDAWAPPSTSPPTETAPVTLPGPTPEQIKEQEAERRKKEEEEQIRKIQLMGLEKQTRDQKQQLEELQKLTQQQLELQKQIAMQTGSQQQQQVLQLQVQKQQLEQQQQIAQATGLQQGFSGMQSTGISSNGRPRPTPQTVSNPSLSQWQPTAQSAQQPTGFQPLPQQTGFQPTTQSLPQQTGFQPSTFAQQQQHQQQGFQSNSFAQAPQQPPAWQGLQPQMTGFPASVAPVGTLYQQTSVLQPTLSPQQVNVQPTGRNWNTATPANPFGSPSFSPLQAQMTGVQFSTPNPQAFNQSPLQAQMTGMPPVNSVFTPQGSMQYGQSAFPTQRPWQ